MPKGAKPRAKDKPPRGFDRVKKMAANVAKSREKINRLLYEVLLKEERNKTVLDGVADELDAIVGFVKAWADGERPRASKDTVLTAIAGLVYLVLPLDVIPDVLPGIGLIDDVAVIRYVHKTIASKLNLSH